MLNRIHHIVQRPHRPPDSMPHLPTTIYGVLRLQLARWLTSPTMPVRLRIPGLLGLMHAWLLFTVVTLQTARVWPLQVVDKVDNLHLETLVPEQLASVATIAHALATAIDWVGGWAADKKMGDVCWSVFLSVCAGLVFSALANGLDRA